VPLAYKEMGRVRILAIEDEQKLAQALEEGLRSERYEVTLARTGEEGFFLARTESFN
jgi:DNA-binding response OmpR family regulator